MATGNSLDACDRAISAISREANALRRELAASARRGEGFSRAMEKVEDQLHFAKKKLGRKPSDLDINEVAILAEKISGELETLVPAAFGAAVASESRYVRSEFREVRALLSKMRGQLAGMEKKVRKSKCKPGKIALLSFTNHARLARAKLLRLSRLQKQKEGREYKRLFFALGEAEGLSVRAEELLIKNTKARLKHKIGDTKTEIMGFMRRAGSGRVFLDHKHLTLRAGHDRLTLSFSPEVRYCLEELAPVSHWLSNVGKNAVLVGSFEKHNGGALLKIGERAVVGNSIVYRECSVLLS
jgi:hypothetical protein